MNMEKFYFLNIDEDYYNPQTLERKKTRLARTDSE